MANGGSGDSQQVMCDRSLRRVPAPDDYVEFLEADTEQSVVDRFEEQVRLHADRTAVKVDDVVVTYDELNRAANRIACAILARLPAPCEPPLASEGKTLEDVSEPFDLSAGLSERFSCGTASCDTVRTVPVSVP